MDGHEGRSVWICVVGKNKNNNTRRFLRSVPFCHGLSRVFWPLLVACVAYTGSNHLYVMWLYNVCKGVPERLKKQREENEEERGREEKM